MSLALSRRCVGNSRAGHVLVGEPREPGVARVNAMRSARSTFACPFCPLVKGSRMASRVHLRLQHKSDFRSLRQRDGSFQNRVVPLFGQELRQWVDRCRRKNRHFGPRRRAPRGGLSLMIRRSLPFSRSLDRLSLRLLTTSLIPSRRAVMLILFQWRPL